MAYNKTDDRITRLPREFGGEAPLTARERKVLTVVYHSVWIIWVLMMVVIALH